MPTRKLLWLVLCAVSFAQDPSNANVIIVGNPAQPVQPTHWKAIQDAINRAGPLGFVVIPADYPAGEPISNPNNTLILDLRSGSFGFRGGGSGTGNGGGTGVTLCAPSSQGIVVSNGVDCNTTVAGLSDIAAAAGYVPANDANVIHTTQTELIGGLKTFTSDVTLTGNLNVAGNVNLTGVGPFFAQFKKQTGTPTVVAPYDGGMFLSSLSTLRCSLLGGASCGLDITPLYLNSGTAGNGSYFGPPTRAWTYGTHSGQATLDIEDTDALTAANTFNTSVNIERTLAPVSASSAISQALNINLSSSVSFAQNVTQVLGVDVTVGIGGTGAVAEQDGLWTQTEPFTTGLVTNNRATVAQCMQGGMSPAVITNNTCGYFQSGADIAINATGSVTNDQTIFVTSPRMGTSPSTLTHHDGIFLQQQNNGGSQNPDAYAIREAGTTDRNLFGRVGTVTDCEANSISPAVCGDAPAGAFVVPTTTTSYSVSTTAISPRAHIFIQARTDNTGLPSSPTCVAPASGFAGVSARLTNGVSGSFTLTLPSTVGTTCWDYWIVSNP